MCGLSGILYDAEAHNNDGVFCENLQKTFSSAFKICETKLSIETQILTKIATIAQEAKVKACMGKRVDFLMAVTADQNIIPVQPCKGPVFGKTTCSNDRVQWSLDFDSDYVTMNVT